MIWQIAINGYDRNFSYLIGNEDKEIAIVDPGDLPLLKAKMAEANLKPRMILVTHSHHDHIEGVAQLVREFSLPVYIHKKARGRVDVEEKILKTVDEGDVVQLGDLEIKVLYTPGHIDDAVCYYFDGKLITGDTVFVEGCGRADLPHSNVENLYLSIQKIKALPDDTAIYPGHDYGSVPVSTIAHEKQHNRFFLAKDFEEFRRLRMGF